MKKVFLMISMMALITVSCKKDYVCECRRTEFSSGEVTSFSLVYHNESLIDATAGCNGHDYTSSEEEQDCTVI